MSNFGELRHPLVFHPTVSGFELDRKCGLLGTPGYRIFSSLFPGRVKRIERVRGRRARDERQ